MKEHWAYSPAEEKSGFEWFVDFVMARRKAFPTMHVYHFGGYEPGAFKNLMGLYATREEEIDSMLRAGLFVDLHAVFKQALRAGVEEYSLKTLEHFAGFKRTVDKLDSRAAMRYITHSLELGWADAIPDKFITDMESYNRDDCFATSALRDWLESQRTAQIAAGHKMDRPPLGDRRTNGRTQRPPTTSAGTRQKTNRRYSHRSGRTRRKTIRNWLLAQLLDFHRRESKTYWEGYRLAELDEDLFDERPRLRDSDSTVSSNREISPSFATPFRGRKSAFAKARTFGIEKNELVLSPHSTMYVELSISNTSRIGETNARLLSSFVIRIEALRLSGRLCTDSAAGCAITESILRGYIEQGETCCCATHLASVSRMSI